MKKTVIVLGCVVLAGAVALLCMRNRLSPSRPASGERETKVARPIADGACETGGICRPQGGGVAAAEEAEQPVPTAEEKAEAEAEAKVDAFDGLTDKWMEPAKDGVTMKDVADFTAAFRAVPKGRKDECIHRALNLIPDENVMLLAGVLMDKSEDKEIVEAVFGDVLNRDEDVKKPILRQIFADKTHPCWNDTAWILDVTGELPAKK